MKRILCLILIAAAALSLWACGGSGKPSEPVQFYYLLREPELLYDRDDGIIRPETREGAGFAPDAAALLGLYLHGPLDDTLDSPFPAGTKLLSVHREGSTLTLELSHPFSSLQGLDLSLACACLSLTAMELTGVESVTIRCDQINVTMDRDTLLLIDTSLSDPSQPVQ